MDTNKIKLLIADDSAIIRGMLEKNFQESGAFEIIDSVSNGKKAEQSATQKSPDIAILDIDMPEMNGLDACSIISGTLKIPVVIFSEDASAAERARQSGAALFYVKPNLSSFKKEFFKDLIQKVQDIALKNVSAKKELGVLPLETQKRGQNLSAKNEFKVLCIGASTGGPTAVQNVLCGLGEEFPLPVLYVQHLDVGADKKMADWFDSSCQNIYVKLAENGEVAKPGTVYLSPADRHLVIDCLTSEGLPILKLSDEPEDHFLRPAVNKLFKSAAAFYKSSCLAVLMTGMGRDGAEGCKVIVENGGHTIAEDKSTCAVFGMPAAAIELGAATEVLPRQEIPQKILSLVQNDGAAQ